MNQSITLHEVGKDPHFKIWHAAEMHMFLYTYSDGGNIVCSEKVYPIRNGVLCFVGAGKYHYTMPDEPEHYERSKLFIYPEHRSGIRHHPSANCVYQQQYFPGNRHFGGMRGGSYQQISFLPSVPAKHRHDGNGVYIENQDHPCKKLTVIRESLRFGSQPQMRIQQCFLFLPCIQRIHGRYAIGFPERTSWHQSRYNRINIYF